MGRVHPASVVFTFRPIERWSGASRRPRASQFKVTPGRTQDDLRVELAYIGVRSCVIQADLGEDDIRLDGMPRANARWRSSRVVVSFTHPQQGEVSFPCGTYKDFWHNVRAVVKTLEALRAVDRHGVTQRAEQYTGWRALPGGGTAIVVGAFASLEDAARFLLKTGGFPSDQRYVERVIGVADDLKQIYDAAARRAHPDVAGGSDALMSRVNAARDFIRGGG